MTLDPPESHLRWIERRERSLRDPDGWLALVALHWLPPGTSTICAVGETTGDRLVLPGALASPAVTFELEAPRLLVVPGRGVTATLDGKPLPTDAPMELRDDRTGPGPVLRFGRLHVTHVHRQHRAALRVRDREAASLMRFRGVPRFPFDPGAVVDARFEPAPPDTTVPITLITEHVEEHPVAGTLRFEIDGRPCSLLAEQSGTGLFVVFGDATNRATGSDGTYGGGRFLSLAAPDPAGRVEIDFNRAVNPPCSFTPYATCPTPPAANRLPMAVRAGERRTH